MRKYYTLDEAVKRNERTKEPYVKDWNIGFCRGFYNLTRFYFGLHPKEYYFENKDKGLKK